MEVAPGIHRIETLLGNRLLCLFLLVGGEQILLVDTGLDETPQASIVPYLESVGLSTRHIRYVLTTHADFDHMGGNASLREIAPDAIFLCHELDRPLIEDVERLIEKNYGQFRADHGIDETDESKAWIRASARGIPMDLGLAGGERLRLGTDWTIEILHTPGHTRGHLSIYDPRSHTAVITDTSLWHGLVTADGAPAFPPTYRFVDTYVASTQRLQGLRIDTLLTSHYPLQTGPVVSEFLSETRAYVDRVETALRHELRQSRTARSARDLIDTLGPRLGEWADNTYLVYPLVGHLERLAQYGLVNTTRQDGLIMWRWAEA
jgi:glyoxylase-like metal-dependent hydrolase (beta-lactamase superfamily II)